MELWHQASTQITILLGRFGEMFGRYFWIFYTFLWRFLYISIFYNAFCVEKRKNLDFPILFDLAQCLYNFYGLLTLSGLGALFKYFMYRRTVQNISIHPWNWTYNFSLSWTKTNQGLYKDLHERHLVSKWKFLANSWIALFQVGEASPHRPQVHKSALLNGDKVKTSK